MGNIGAGGSLSITPDMVGNKPPVLTVDGEKVRSVYRGQAPTVTFDPPQSKVWEDTRDGGNSPWSAGWVNPPIPHHGDPVVAAVYFLHDH